jgi:hypothetical protein
MEKQKYEGAIKFALRKRFLQVAEGGLAIDSMRSHPHIESGVSCAEVGNR